MENVIALDPGFGNTKVCSKSGIVCIQSAVAVPVGELGLSAIMMRVPQKPLRVQWEGGDFYVGQGAWYWGRPIDSLDYSLIGSPEAMALFYGALSRFAEVPEEVKLVIGLPVPFLQETDAATLKAVGERLKGEHRFRVDGREFALRVTGIKVLAQPLGAFFDWGLNEEGIWAKTKKEFETETAICDIGANTLDVYAIAHGEATPRFIGGAKVGTRRLLELVGSDGRSFAELDAELRSGRLDVPIDVWVTEVVGAIERIWGNPQRFARVIMVGGGMLIAGEQIARKLKARQVIIPDQPHLANVRGLWKWGQRKGVWK